LLIRWRSALKTVSTFLEGIDIARDGRVHASWRAFGTVTARLSCRDPNLQNLVRRVLRADLKKASKERIKELGDEAYELESRVREMYIAAPGHLWIYFDLAQSEARAAAYLSGDDAFIQVCENGDVHAGNAAILFPDAAELLRTDPKGKGKIYRDVAKNALFAILYRADVSTVLAYLLSQGFDVSLGDVEAMFDAVKQTYARYNAYCDENLESCRRQGFLRTALSGRIRRMSYFPKPTETANFVVQSCIADLMNERLLAIDAQLPRCAHIIAQIHDAAIIEVPTQDAQDISDIVKEVWSRKIFVPTSGKEFVMPIDAKCGERWSDF
jgi:DNA polymerase-1